MLARSVGLGEAHCVNGGCWLSKWIGSFQSEECRWPGHHNEEEVKPINVHVAVMDPGCLLFDLEQSLATGQQLNSSFKNWDLRRA